MAKRLAKKPAKKVAPTPVVKKAKGPESFDITVMERVKTASDNRAFAPKSIGTLEINLDGLSDIAEAKARKVLEGL